MGTTKIDRGQAVNTICQTPPPPGPQPIKHWAGTRHARATAVPELVTLLKSRMEERLV